MTATDDHAPVGRRLRLLLLAPHAHVRGPIPKIVPLLVDHLRLLGCAVETASWGRHTDEETLLSKTIGRTADIARIRRQLRRRPVDVLFIATAHNWGGLLRDIPLVLATRRLCAHRVLHFHGSHSDRLVAPGHRLLKLASRLLVRQADATLVLSTQERDEWSAFLPNSRFDVVTNPFVPDAAAPIPLDAARELSQTTPPAEPTILYVGRLVPQKGVADLLQALAHLNAAVPCRLVVAGDGPSANALAQQARLLGIADKIDWRGHVSGEALGACYRQADVFVLPSYREGFPTVLPEAMSRGLPIVTTNLPGAAERLAEGVNALFIPPREPEKLAEAIERLLADDGLRATMAANNLAKVKEFAPAAVTPRYLTILERVARDSAPRRAPSRRREEP